MTTAFKLRETDGNEMWVPATTQEQAIKYYGAGPERGLQHIVFINNSDIDENEPLNTLISFAVEEVVYSVEEIISNLLNKRNRNIFLICSQELYMLANQLNINPLKDAISEYIPNNLEYDAIINSLTKSSNKDLDLLKSYLLNVFLCIESFSWMKRNKDDMRPRLVGALKMFRKYNLLLLVNCDQRLFLDPVPPDVFYNPDQLDLKVIKYSFAQFIENNFITNLYLKDNIFFYVGNVEIYKYIGQMSLQYMRLIDNVQSLRNTYISEILPRLRSLAQLRIQETSAKSKLLPNIALDNIVKQIIETYDPRVTDNNVRKIVNYILSGKDMGIDSKDEFLDYIFVE